MTFGDLKQKDPEPKSIHPTSIIPREVDMSDLPSDKIKDMELFRQVLNIPDTRNTMPVPSASVWGLNKVAQQRVVRPKGSFAMLPVSPTLKEALDKFDQDLKAANLLEGKFIKPPPAKWYKLGNSCLEKMQELNTDFASICISPKPSGTLIGKVPMQVVKEFKHQARQNLCTINFSAALNRVISECNMIMESCRDSLKATSKRVKTHIQERAAKKGCERICDDLDILYRRINIQQRALAC